MHIIYSYLYRTEEFWIFTNYREDTVFCISDKELSKYRTIAKYLYIDTVKCYFISYFMYLKEGEKNEHV